MNKWNPWKAGIGHLTLTCLIVLLGTACKEESTNNDENIDTDENDTSTWNVNEDDTNSEEVDTTDTGVNNQDSDTTVETDGNVQWSDDFESLTSIDELWTMSYAALAECTAPFFVPTAGQSKISLIDGSIKLYSARFAIAMSDGLAAEATTATTSPGGELDLTADTVVTIVISAAADVEPGDADEGQNKFIVYLDNNTTSSDSSMWGDAAKIINAELSELATQLESTNPLTLTATIPLAVGTETSFLQFRTESGGSVTIDSISISGTPKTMDECEDPVDTDTAVFGEPACPDGTSKGDACTPSGDVCYKTCGPSSIGRKSETCTSLVWVEGDCTFEPGVDMSCYTVPATIDTTACGTDTTPPQSGTACTVDECVTCSDAAGLYLDSSGTEKTGYCTCVGGSWTCASTSSWPCPGSDGC